MRNYLLLGVILCTILSCNHNQNNNKESQTLADSAYNKQVQKNNTTNETELSKNAILKTVDIKFKVKDVVSTTSIIENICNTQGGFVTYCNLVSNINNKTSIAVSVDSSVETNYYSVSNSIIIRVPNNKLDTVLKAIAINVDYLDHRIIKADDVALQIFTNKLTQNRIKKNETRLTKAIDKNNSKLVAITNAEDLLLSKQEQSDNSKIENLSLDDQVNFSTVNLAIYQNDITKRTMFASEKGIKIYEPGFGSKMADSFLFGWNIVIEILVFFSKFWAILFFAVLIYLLYKKIVKSKVALFPKALILISGIRAFFYKTLCVKNFQCFFYSFNSGP